MCVHICIYESTGLHLGKTASRSCSLLTIQSVRPWTSDIGITWRPAGREDNEVLAQSRKIRIGMPSWCRWFLSAALQILPSRLGSRVSIFSNEWLTSPWRNLLLSLGSLNLREFSRRRSSDPALWMAFTPQSSSSWRSFNRETGLALDQMIFPGVPTSPSPSWFWYDLVGYFFMICSD